MSSYIPKQPKQTRDRVEAKLDRELIRTLESYCQYLESDRDYIIGKALELAFKKDKAFGEWLATQAANGEAGSAKPESASPAESPAGPHAQPQAEKWERKSA